MVAMTNNEYNRLLEEVGIFGKVEISKEEAEGQENIIKEKSTPNRYGISEVHYYRVDKGEELTDEQIKIALMAKQTLHIKSIRSMVTFFTTLAAIGIVGWILILFMNFAS